MIAGFNPSPRQIRTGLDLLTGAMVISVAFALAGLTWRIAGHAGTGAITVPSGASGPAAPADIAPAIALAPFGKGQVSDATVATTLPLVLKGLIASGASDQSTAFISMDGQPGQPAQPFHVGQSVGAASIQGITRDRVILNNGGRTEYLGFPDPSAVPPPAASQPIVPGGAQPAPAPAPAQPARPVPAPVSAAAPGGPSGLPGLLQRFNATPSDGGYRIGANPPAGLLEGDVVISINGTALADTQAAGAAFANAQGSGTANVQLLRGGKRFTLTVPIR
jgi:general secretion pathway protein C